MANNILATNCAQIEGILNPVNSYAMCYVTNKLFYIHYIAEFVVNTLCSTLP